MSLGQKAIKSTIFVALTSYAGEGVNFIVSIILARLLLPEHFGIIALAMFFLELFGRVREFGFDQALIHRQTDPIKARATHFLLQVGTSLFSVILTLAFGPLLLRFYAPEVVQVLIIFSLFYLLKAATATPRIVLEKDLRFANSTSIDFFALVFSSILAVVTALAGFGLWSLVVYQVANTVFAGIAFWRLRSWEFVLVIDRDEIIWFLKFGFFLWLGGLTTFILFKYNDFIAGTFLGTATLGFYSRAFTFAQRPTSSITSVVSRVALPTYALLQHDREKLSFTFNFVLRNIVRFSAPLSLLLFLLADDFTNVLLGEKWLPMIPIFRLLLIYGFLRSVFDDAGAFLTAIGKPQLVSVYLGVQALIILITTPLLIRSFGINGAAISLDFVLLVGIILAYFFVSRFVNIDYAGIIWPSFLPAAVTWAFSLYFQKDLIMGGAGPTFLFRLLILIGVYALSALIVGGRQMKEDSAFLWQRWRT